MYDWLVWIANPMPDWDGWQRFVFLVAWQSTVVAAVALLAARLARRPATRAWVLLLGIVASLLAPLATTVVGELGWGLLAAEAVAAGDAPVRHAASPQTANDDAAILQVAPPSVGDANSATPAATHEPSRRGWAWLAAAWLTASIFLAARLVASYWRLRIVVRRAASCVDPRAVAMAERIAARLRVGKPRILLSDEVRCPTVCGGRRPIVLVNRRDRRLFCDDGAFDAAAWEAMLRHELAHVRRRDGRSRLAVEAMLATLPWQPLLWSMRRHFFAAAEEACDDWAVFDGSSAVDLAELLTNYVSSFSSYPIGMAMNARDTKRRILRLLNSHASTSPTTAARLRGLLAASAVLLVVAVAAAQRPADDASDQSAKGGGKSGEIAAAANDAPFGKDRPYVIEPPDILKIEIAKLVPKTPQRINKLDTLRIVVEGTIADRPIFGSFKVDVAGDVTLGAIYGKVRVCGQTEAEATATVVKHLKGMLVDPLVRLSIEEIGEKMYIEGQHLVSPDGSINLGVFGAVYVNGLTLAEARKAVETALSSRFDEVSLAVDVYAYNSKAYYVIEDNENGGDRVSRMVVTGNDTVLDALANVESLRIREGTQIWISRRGKDKDQKLVVDWTSVVRGDSKTNYRLWPGDRLFVSQAADK